MAPNNTNTIKTTTQELFKQLGFDNVEVAVEKTEEDQYKIQVNSAAEESGILIGYHGETISSLQLLISLILHQQTKTWSKLTLNINDYRQKRQQSLTEMAESAAQRVKDTGEEVMLPPLSGFDRRLIHLSLSKNPDVKTESVGEGKDRRLIVSKASK